MRERHDEIYHGTTVEMDGCRFLRCEFHDCRLLFAGESAFEILDSRFEGATSWVFDGRARMMLYIMASISLLPGGGNALGKAMAEVIRANRPETLN